MLVKLRRDCEPGAVLCKTLQAAGQSVLWLIRAAFIAVSRAWGWLREFIVHRTQLTNSLFSENEMGYASLNVCTNLNAG